MDIPADPPDPEGRATSAATDQWATPEEWDEWLTLYDNRDLVATEYAALARFYAHDWPGFKELNKAILRRWLPSGLRYIKEKAWKIPV